MRVAGIDHVHVHVRDREAAATWYGTTLGLTRSAGLAHWANHARGPLMLEGANGRPAIALFAEPGSAAGGGRTIAFLTDRDGFLGFLDALGQRDLRDRNGHRVGPEALVDHDVAWSIYFRDPDGNHLELTTYDYAEVAKKIGRGAGEAGG